MESESITMADIMTNNMFRIQEQIIVTHMIRMSMCTYKMSNFGAFDLVFFQFCLNYDTFRFNILKIYIYIG